MDVLYSSYVKKQTKLILEDELKKKLINFLQFFFLTWFTTIGSYGTLEVFIELVVANTISYVHW